MNENDTVVVIGGSSGLGLAVARRRRSPVPAGVTQPTETKTLVAS